MSLQKIGPLAESAELIEVQSLYLEEKTSDCCPSRRAPALPIESPWWAIIFRDVAESRRLRRTCVMLCTQSMERRNCWRCRLTIPKKDTIIPPGCDSNSAKEDLASYREAADFLNFSNVDLVCLQHEYGIFGGPAGSHILELLRRLAHAVRNDAAHGATRTDSMTNARSMEEIAALSDRLIVMSQHSVEILQEVFHVPAEKIDSDSARRSRICLSQIPISTRTASERREERSCSRLVCCRRTRELKTSSKRFPRFCCGIQQCRVHGFGRHAPAYFAA